MAKSNKKARFAIDKLFKNMDMVMNPRFRRIWLRYLNHDDVIAKTPTIIKVLKEQKIRRQNERQLLKKSLHNKRFRQKRTKRKTNISDKTSRQIQYGFDIAKWMMLQHE